MYLSYSGYKAWKSCHRFYYHRYVGKTKLDAPDNKVNSLYGSIVGTIFELFYTDRIWSRSGVEAILLGMVDDVTAQIIAKESEKSVVDWKDKRSNYKSIEALKEDVVATIPRGIGIIRHHRFLGTDAEAEVKLDTWVDGHIVGGRSDFIMTRVKPHGDLVILDGKGSRWREQYVDHQQLWWYAMLYKLKNKRLPDRLGFVFWRSEPEKSVDWVDFDQASLDDLQAGIMDAITHIEAGKKTLESVDNEPARLQVLQDDFATRPSRDCKLCEFRPVCPDGDGFLSKRFSVPDHTGSGVEDVGL